MGELSNPDFEQLRYDDAQALATMTLHDHDEMVTYQSDGSIEVMRFIKTGEVFVREFKVGQKTIALEQESSEPIQFATYNTWAEYTGPITPPEQASDSYLRSSRYSEHDPSFDELGAKIIQKAQETKDVFAKDEKLGPCHAQSCESGKQSYPCPCKEGGSSYTDIDGHTVRERASGTADPECDDCEGSGTASTECYYCHGAGYRILNPLVAIINNQTGEKASFRINAAQLLADSSVELLVQNERQQTRNGVPLPPELRLTIDMADYIDGLAQTVGIDVASGNFVTYWGERPLDAWATTFGHLHKHLATSIPLPESFESEDDFLQAAVNNLQGRITSSIRTDIYGINMRSASRPEIQQHAQKFDLSLNDDLALESAGLRLDQKPSSSAMLKETIAILAQHNYRLGFAFTGIATGETGPALYILDDAGNVLQMLSSGYDEANVLHNAWLRVTELNQTQSF